MAQRTSATAKCYARPITEPKGTDSTLLWLIQRFYATEQALRIMAELGLAAHFERFPQGYLTMLGEGGVPISGGQRQLVGLARALVRQPQLLLIDEPTAHIDSPTEAFVLRLLLALRERMGILCITHSPTVAAHADRIAVLVDGHIAAEGSHQQLMQSDNAYSAAWREMLSASVTI